MTETAALTGSDQRGVPAWRHFLQRRFWFILLVVVPSLLGAIYYTFIASDEYVSEARFVVKSPGQRQSQISSLASLIQTTGLTTGQEQMHEVLDYLHSRSALSDLARQVDLRKVYSDRGADPLSRFPGPFRLDRFENLFRYYTSVVNTSVDTETGVAVVRVRAFTPDDAYIVNENLLRLSEGLVNNLNNRAQDKAIRETASRVVVAEERLKRARMALRNYRNDERLLDPSKQAVGVLELSTQLEAQRSALKAQLQTMEQAAPANPSLPALRQRLRAIEAAIATQDGRAVGGANAISTKMSGYEERALEQQFATENLNAANAALEQARLEAQRQQFYLERVASPNRPDMALYPHRIERILTIIAGLLCLYFTGWMLYVGIIEHAPED